MNFDVIILGLGAMGSSAAWQLARRGKRVLGIEQFTSPHEQGSSHGGSRIIRQAYFESADYIPLVLRSYELWKKLESETETHLLNTTGGLVIGRRDGDLVSRTVAAARKHGIACELLEPSELRRRHPAFDIPSSDIAVFEPHAGYLVPEDCIRAQLSAASSAGADLHFQEQVLSWSACRDGVEVTTAEGVFSGGHLIIAAGPWGAQLMHGSFPLRVTRQVMAWLQPTGGVSTFLPTHFPVFIAEGVNGGFATYGMPAIDGPAGGVKAAVHGSHMECTPQNIDRSIHDSDIARIIEQVKHRIPSLNGQLVRAKTCLYTLTPDEHFIIGAHPQFENCTVACGFSGHGFKFAPVVGEILADFATSGTTPHPISLFSPHRFDHP
jgi:sarcosine oxidase